MIERTPGAAPLFLQKQPADREDQERQDQPKQVPLPFGMAPAPTGELKPDAREEVADALPSRSATCLKVRPGARGGIDISPCSIQPRQAPGVSMALPNHKITSRFLLDTIA